MPGPVRNDDQGNCPCLVVMNLLIPRPERPVATIRQPASYAGDYVYAWAWATALDDPCAQSEPAPPLPTRPPQPTIRRRPPADSRPDRAEVEDHSEWRLQPKRRAVSGGGS